ncbi:MAG: aspartate carbamoyltransferase regulatory subunit [Bacteroidales bacterium]|jgi:aspartate carbamoyltransferase regulatory subunit|nr:aspartate carbamoyltransferase regulatory subunit [Bacteroidales bacterium]
MMKKELVVSAIKNGTVIDHIPADKLFQVAKTLNLMNESSQVLLANNLDSQKIGKKGIIKCQDIYLQQSEINKIALVAPSATLISIRDYSVVEKINVGIPDYIEGTVKCFNPKCITNNENVLPKYNVIDKADLKLQCCYCQKITKKDTLTFL